ncbi:FAD-dependent oxidoreductase [Modestobacter sp. Leaf380]|uniref:FAD-dependent oxidoreductase n=1 Tax=Modestobacter sp. Leaf380 TaxID=1736356 RepID=UPI0006FE5DB6|nr:FAD-dependent oxidoreductase [Modestobacter sp. Leaf380]KQS65702.1 hypothetical protein ASG41_13935 [Modestobacter sp. Leaf380]
MAVVGCGPSGCFTALALRKKQPDVEVVVFDSLPTPYGLIRYGIAPDHQGAKGVHRQFDRLFGQPDVHFAGNVRIHDDGPLSWNDLTETFDAVVVATGLPADRPLGVPQDPGATVLGSGALLRLINSDPDVPARRTGIPDLGQHIAIVGTGNVAADLARLLTKSAAELSGSDINDDARDGLVRRGVRTIHILGRSTPDQARWDPSMVKELAHVSAVDLRVDGVPHPDGAVARGADLPEDAVVIDIRFRQRLRRIESADGLAVVVTSTDEETEHNLTVDTVVSAIGFDLAPEHPVVPSMDADHMFSVGGCMSGRLGNLAENRKLAIATALAVSEYLETVPPATRPGLGGLGDRLPTDRTSFTDWQSIDRAEVERAAPDRCRTKFTSRDELLVAAGIGDLVRPTTDSPATHPRSNR